MKKIILTTLVLGLSAQLTAIDLGGVINAADKISKDPKAAGQMAGDQAGAQLTAKLKSVQNEKGPIVFKKGKADVDASKCERTLKSIDGIIKQFPGFKVEIQGHTDNKGKAAANLALSQKRAEAVRQWLIDHLQTPADAMSAKGYGDTAPIASNKAEAGRSKNRRVDFAVTKI